VARNGSSVTWLDGHCVQLYRLRGKDASPEGHRLTPHADALTFYEDGHCTVVVRDHCFRYRRRLLELLVHEAIHCAEYLYHIEDIEQPADCSRAATGLSHIICQFLENLPREWKRAAGLLG